MANKVITYQNSKIKQRLENKPTEVFLDINMQANNDGKIKRLTNVNAIKNSLHNIFSWQPGERVLNPEFGSKLHQLLYDGINNYNVEQIISEIKHCISVFEPRITIKEIINITTTEETENNTIHLSIVYEIIGLNGIQFNYDYVQQINSGII